jgi:hypothetical protein
MGPRPRLAAGAILLLALAVPGTGHAQSRPTQPNDTATVQTEMRNVDLHVDADTILHVHRLRGALTRTRPGEPPKFDEKDSFIVSIEAAEVTLSLDDLGRLMNRHVFAYKGAPLKNVQASFDEGQLTLSGTAHKGVDLPFSMKANVSAAPDGRVLLKVTSFKTAGVPAKGLLEFFGVELDDLVKMRADRGMEIQDDSVLLDAAGLLPPPRVRGKVTEARVSSDGLHLNFGGRYAPLPRPLPSAKNFLYYRGGVLRFGKLTMNGADLLLVDGDPQNAFDFFQDRYLDQLVAGQAKITRSNGLIVYMPDFRTVAHKPTPPAQR